MYSINIMYSNARILCLRTAEFLNIVTSDIHSYQSVSFIFLESGETTSLVNTFAPVSD
jgi:hypothetical protein